MTANEIRASFLDYFKNNGHRVVELPLVPGDDPTPLFTNAGMNCSRTSSSDAKTRLHAGDDGVKGDAHGKHNDLDRRAIVPPPHVLRDARHFCSAIPRKTRSPAWTLLTRVEAAEDH
jgi:alanyl-tRNA synthetase